MSYEFRYETMNLCGINLLTIHFLLYIFKVSFRNRLNAVYINIVFV